MVETKWNIPPGAKEPGPGPVTAAGICPGAGTPACIEACIRGGAPLTCIPPWPKGKTVCIHL